MGSDAPDHNRKHIQRLRHAAGRQIPVPEVLVHGEIVFDDIPDMEECNVGPRERTGLEGGQSTTDANVMARSDSAFHSPGVRSDHRRMELIYQHNDKPEQKVGKVGFSNMQVPWYAPPIARHTLEPKPV